MARAYSNDLRRKFLQAYDEGEGTLEELAEQFRVSLGWAKKISARRSRTGEVDAPVWRHGPVSRVTPAVQEWIRKQIRVQPDSDPAGAAPAIGGGSAFALKCGADVVSSAPARTGT